MQSGFTSEIHPRKVQKDQEIHNKEKRNIWLLQKLPFMNSPSAYPSLLIDNKAVTYYWMKHPGYWDTLSFFPFFMEKYVFYSILEIPMWSAFSFLSLFSFFLFLVSLPSSLPIHTYWFLPHATFHYHGNKFKDTNTQQRNDKISNISHRKLKCTKK